LATRDPDSDPGDTQRVRARSPFTSLPSRISLLVLAATLATSLTVTAISVQSIDGFLREKIDQKFPTILDTAAQTLDLWLDQRLLEIRVFSSSEILVENLRRMGRAGDRDRERALQELSDYGSYVLESFPQYEALFALDADGEEVLSVGDGVPLSPERLRDLHTVGSVTLGEIFVADDDRLQIASASVRDDDGSPVGTLHALLRVSEVDRILTSEHLGEGGRVFLVGTGGLCLAGDGAGQRCFSHPLPARGEATRIDDYDDAEGQRVVGGARRLERFDWTLVVEEPYREAFAPVLSSIRRVLGINLAIVMALGLIAFRLAVSIVKPIEKLSDAARRIANGERDVLLPEATRKDEVGVLTTAFNEMTTRLAHNALELEKSRMRVAEANERLRERNEQLQSVNEILEQLSITDGLTKLHNHRYFQDILTRECKRADRTSEPLVLVLVDIDHFKAWNDRLGHAGGDEILRRIAQLMCEVVRETDHLARYGGEEFALLAPNTDLEGATQLAEKVRTTISETRFLIDPPSEHRQVTVSIGVAPYRGDRDTLFNDADRALYRAKAGGRDCVVVDEDANEL